MRNFSAREAGADEQMLKLAHAIDEFEAYQTAHASRVAAIADSLARCFNFASHDLSSLRQAALVHDIGEMSMNRYYIKTTRKLRADERVDMQRHTVIGEQEASTLR